MTTAETTPTRPSPLDGIAEVGRRRLVLLGALGALKALGLVLVADAIAVGIVTVIANGDIAAAVAEGIVGALLRAVAVWGLRVVSQSAAGGVKQRLRLRLAAALRHRGGGAVGADATLASHGLDDLDAYYTSYLPSLVSAVTVPLLVGMRILAADWVSALVIVITIPLIPLFMALIGMHTRDRVAASLDALGRLSDHLVELARGLPVLVGLGRDREQAQALADISDDHRRRSITALRTAFLSALALDLLATISVAVVAVIIGIRLLHGQLTLEAGLVALILAPECYAPIREIGAAFHASDAGREALRRVRTVIDRAPGRARLVRRAASHLAVRNLSVTHRGRGEPAVVGLSFDAPRGGITLLSGPSGSGKSTVLAVLTGRGATLADDDDSDRSRSDALCSGTVTAPPADRVVWMPQHPHFSSRTLRDEVTLYSPRHHPAGTARGEATDAVTQLERVGLGSLADQDPAELSPGEARRLAFARVLAAVEAGAELVLLDEPTAHLDPESAALVRGEMVSLRHRVTTILASHDPQLHALADHVVPLDTRLHGVSTAPAPTVPSLAADLPHIPSVERGPRAIRTDKGQASDAPSIRGAFGELIAFLRPVRLRMLAAIFVGVLSSAFAVALTAISGWLIVRASQEPAIMYLLVAIVGVRFFGVGRSALRYAERLLTHDAVFRATTALRVRLWGALAAAGPAGRAALTATNTLSALVGAADRVRDLVPRVVQPPVAAVLVLAGSALALGLLFPPAALAIAGLAVVALIVAPAVAIAVGRVSARRGEASRAGVLTSFTDLLVARDDLTPLASGRIIRRLAAADRSEAAAERGTARAEGAAAALVVLACCLAAIGMLPLTAAAVTSGSLRPELVAVLVMVPLSLVEPLLDGVAASTRAPALFGVLAHVHAVTRVQLVVPGDADDGGSDTDGGKGETVDLVSGIRLDNVAYRYPGSRDSVFTGVSAQAGRGEWIAVTGPSGSGKSTLLAMLLRFADPERGRYTLQRGDRQTDARTLAPRALRTSVAWCPQEGHLFDSTLRANLTIARSHADRPSEPELADAVARVGLAPLVATLPDGLDTRIGAAGERLSGGQRQRLAVARTLLARGDVVLLDEPTAQLDEQASAELMADLRNALRDKITVLVTHDAIEARCADRVIELGDPSPRRSDGLSEPSVPRGRAAALAH